LAVAGQFLRITGVMTHEETRDGLVEPYVLLPARCIAGDVRSDVMSTLATSMPGCSPLTDRCTAVNGRPPRRAPTRSLTADRRSASTLPAASRAWLTN